jgi:thioredoxin-like negative regulator of GroEL
MKRSCGWTLAATGLAALVTAGGVAASWSNDALPHQSKAPRGSVGETPSIPWHTRMETAREAAVSANRPMLLEFWAGWCEPCKVMDAEVYSNAQVIEAMKGLVPLRVDLDAQGRLARTYNVESIPTLVFTDSHGNELFRYSGLLHVGPMVQLLRELPGDITRINQLSRTIAANKADVEALAALGGELRRVSLYRASNVSYGRALDKTDLKRRRDSAAAILLAMGQNHLDLKEAKEAGRLFERCVREFPGTAAATEAAALLERR